MSTPQSETEAAPVEALWLGRLSYGPVWELQERLQDRLIEAKRAQPPEPLPHLLLLVEHPPVYTLGKNGNDEHLLISRERAQANGIEYFEIDRGGDLTYHGPGQLVGYPILDLDRVFTDIGRYLRTLEETIVRTCADFDIATHRVEGRTGVWTGTGAEERKICAMGIRCSRWVTMHGFAFNVTTDLDPFGDIVPCGISDRGVTSLAQELGREPEMATVRRRLIGHFSDAFGLPVREPESDPTEVLSGYAPEAPALLEEAAPRTSQTEPQR